MKFYKLKFFLLLLLVLLCNIGFAINTISFDNYLNLVNYLNQNINKIDKNKLKKFIHNNNIILKCEFFETDKYFLVSPYCFLKNQIPNISLTNAINNGFFYIKDFSNKFIINKPIFIFTGSRIIRKKEYFENYTNFLNLITLNSTGENILNIILLTKKYYIKIPKQYIYRKILDSFSFYVSTKNLSNRGNCRRHNYLIAIKQLNGKILLPGEKLNYNLLLSKIPNNLYCRKGNKKYLFYEGVCGASTQLFRNSLLNPNLIITKRYNHTKRYAKYYSKYIYGDDAAIYQWTKQFEIKNIGKYPIYFKTFDKSKNNIYLVSIIPTQIKDKTIIIRKQLGKLSAIVGKIVFDKNFKEKYSQFWISKYCCKYY